jgi:PleD family two-component response regulator
MLPDIDSKELDRISDVLVNEVEKCFVKDEEKNLNIGFKVTVGASSITMMTKNITGLLEQANKALYVAKVAKKTHSKTNPKMN